MRNDIDGFAALFSDNYVNHQASAAAPLPPPNVTPKQGTVAFFKARITGLPDLKVAIEAMVADKDHVAASFIYPGTHKGTYFGIAPTGRSLRFTSCDIFRVQDEHIVEHWGLGDIAVSWHNTARDISFEEMSAIGIKRTFVFALRTSAIGGKADIAKSKILVAARVRVSRR